MTHVPVVQRTRLKKAVALYEDFTGHDAQFVDTHYIPNPPKKKRLGLIVAILYETTRDHVNEKYIHTFRPKSRPTLKTSTDNKLLFIEGGRFKFTETGINDVNYGSQSRKKEFEMGLIVGRLDAIVYLANGNEYQIDFEGRSRPLLCASWDGKQLFIVDA